MKELKLGRPKIVVQRAKPYERRWPVGDIDKLFKPAPAQKKKKGRAFDARKMKKAFKPKLELDL